MASKEFHALQERLAAAPPPDPNLTLPQRRAGIDATMGQLPLAEGITATERTIEGVPVIECAPAAPAPAPVVLWFHGGGFRLASALAYRSYGSHLAALTGGRVVLVDYRLAPEHPWPAAVDDVTAVYRGLLAEGVPASSVVPAGDSAGGNLSAAVILTAKRDGLPLPAGFVCCSPWVDLTNSAASYSSRAAVDKLFSLQSATEASAAYLSAGGDRRDPLVSPVFGDFSGAPPALIQVGDAEVLLDDAERLATVLRAAGVAVRHRVYPEMPHVWQLSYPAFPEAVEAVQEIAAFAREVTG